MFNNPIVTYYITRMLDGRLAVTPSSPTYNTYNIVLDKPKSFRESIETSIVYANGAEPGSSAARYGAQYGGVAGHCVTQVSTGKFLDFSVNKRNFEVQHSGDGKKSKYFLRMGGRTHDDVKWVDDSRSGSRTSDGRLKLEDGNGNALARFGGSGGSGNEFGMLEIYDHGQAATNIGVDWCGLVILTGVSVYLREVRRREKAKKRANDLGAMGSIMGSLTG